MDKEGTESDWGDLLEQARRSAALARDELDLLIEQLS